MNKINLRLNGVLPRSSTANIPKFTFLPVDLAGNEKFQKTCLELWKEGVVSTRTLLQTHGYDMGQEQERLQSEGGTMVKPHDPAAEDKPTDGKPGRPELDDSERTSDPAKALTSKAPKPSRDGKDSLG